MAPLVQGEQKRHKTGLPLKTARSKDFHGGDLLQEQTHKEHLNRINENTKSVASVFDKNPLNGKRLPFGESFDFDRFGGFFNIGQIIGHLHPHPMFDG